MKKLALFAAAVCLCAVAILLAADPWQSKPYTEWSEKDIQKVLTNSPWSRALSVSSGQQSSAGNTIGRDDGSSRPAGASASTGPGMMQPNGQESGVARDRMGDIYSQGTESNSIVLMVVWQSAMPVRQALVRRRFGTEGAGSADAKKFLDEHANYLIAVSGITPQMVRAQLAKSAILEKTTLAAKGKDALHATDILISPSGKVTEAVFVFPKTAVFALEDKEVEFSTQIGAVEVRNKFRLKDMVVNGALQL